MTSYVQKEERMFREAGDSDLVPRRSVGRIKEYASCTDRRAWIVNDEPRRQYILEMIKTGSHKTKCFGKFIPVEALIDILLAESQQRIKELERLVALMDSLLTPEQRARLAQLLREDEEKSSLYSSAQGTEIDDEEGAEVVVGGVDDEEPPKYCAAGGGGLVKKKKPAAAGQVPCPDDPGFTADMVDISSGATSRDASPVGIDSRSTPGGASGRSTPGGVSGRSTPGGAGVRSGSPGEESGASSRGRSPAEKAFAEGGKVTSTPKGKRPLVSGRPDDARGSDDAWEMVDGQEGGTPSTYPVGQAAPGDSASQKMGAASGGGSRKGTPSEDTKAQRPDSKGTRYGGAKSDVTTASGLSGAEMPYSTASYADLTVDELKNLIYKKDLEIGRLTDQLTKLGHIISSNKDLEKQLTKSQLQLANLASEKGHLAKAVASTRPQDLSNMEAQIEEMRTKGELTPEAETEIIKKELEVLRKYCDDLSDIQEENERLRQECENLKQMLKESGKGDNDEIRALQKKIKEYQDQVAYLKSKLSTSMQELLESEEITNLRRKSDIVDDVLREREQLREQIDEIPALRRRSQEADQLEKLNIDLINEKKNLESQKRHLEGAKQCLECSNKDLSNELNELKKYRTEENNMVKSEMQKYQEQISHQCSELQCLKSSKNKLNKALEAVQMERDGLLQQLQGMEKQFRDQQEEIGRARQKAQEADFLKLEIDRLHLRLEELQALELEVLTLVEQIKNMSMEKDMYKRQTCELECVVADQEDEIRQLLTHIDRLSESVEKQQGKIKRALENMQTELDEKNNLLVSSTDELSNMAQMKCTIQKLQKILREKQELICKLTGCSDADDKDKEPMTRALEEAQRENCRLQELVCALKKACQFKHIDILLAESKQAIDVVVNEVQSFYEERMFEEMDSNMICKCGMDESIYDENKQLRKHSMEIQNLAKNHIEELTQQLQQCIQENANLRAENDLLQSMKQGIQTDLKSINSQLEDNVTSSDAVCRCQKLKEQIEELRKENEALRGRLEESTMKKKIYISDDYETDVDDESKSFTTVEDIDDRNQKEKLLDEDHPEEIRIASPTKPISPRVSPRKPPSPPQFLVGKPLFPEDSQENRPFSPKGSSGKSSQGSPGKPASPQISPRATASPEISPRTTASPQTSPKATISPQVSEDKPEILFKVYQIEPTSVEEEECIACEKYVSENAEKELSIEPKSSKIVAPCAIDEIPSEDVCTSCQKYLDEHPDALDELSARISFERSVEEAPAIVDYIQLQQELPARVSFERKPEETATIIQEEAKKIRLSDEIVATVEDQIVTLEFTSEEGDTAKKIRLSKDLQVLEDKKEVFPAAEREAIEAPQVEMEVKITMRSPEEENEDLKEELQEKTAMVQRLSQEMEQIPAQTIELISSVSSQIKEEGENLRLENIELKKEIGRLEIELREKSAQLGLTDTDLFEVNKKLEARILELQNELENYAKSSSTALDESETGIRELKKINKELESQVGHLKNEIDRLAAVISEGGFGDVELVQKQKADINRLEDELKNLININAQVRRDSLETESESSDLKMINYQLQTKIKELERQLEELHAASQDNESFKDLIRAQEKEITELASENKRLSVTLQDSDLSFGSGDITDDRCKKLINKLKNEILDLQCENNCLRMCLTSTSPTDEKVAMLELDVRDRNKRLEKEIQELKEELECMRTCEAGATGGGDNEALVNSLRAQLDDKIRGCAQLEAELQAELNKLRAMIDDLEKENAMLGQQLSAFTGGDDQIATLLAKIKELEEAKGDCESREKKLKDEIKDLMDRLESNVLRGSMTEGELEAEIRKLKAKIADLEDTINQQINTINTLKGSGDGDRCKELEDLVKQLQADKAHLESRVAQMQREQDELTDKLGRQIRTSSLGDTERESELIKLRAKVNELENVIKELQNQLSDCKAKLSGSTDKKFVSDLEAKLNNLTDEKNALVSENSSLKSRLEDLEKQLAILKAEKDEFMNSMKALDAYKIEIDALKNEITALKKELDKIMTESSQDKALIDSLTKENNSLKKDMNELTGKLQLVDEAGDMRAEKDALNNLIKSLEQQLKACEEEAAAISGQNLAEQIKKLQAEIDRLKKEHEKELADRLAEYEKNLTLAKEQYERDSNYLKAKHDEAITRLQKALEDNANDAAKNFQQEIDNLQKQLADAMQKVKVCQDNMKQKEDRANELEKQLKSIQDALQSKEDEIAKLKKDLDNEKTKVAGLEKQIEEEKKRLADATKALSDKSSELDKLQKDLESEKGKLAELSKTLDAEKAKCKQLEDEKNKNAEELSQLKKDLDNEKNKLVELTKSLDSEKNKNADLSKALQDEKNKGDSTNDELAKLLKDLQNEKDKLSNLQNELEKEKGKSAEAAKALETANSNNSSKDNELSKVNDQLSKANDQLSKAEKDLTNEKSKNAQLAKDLEEEKNRSAAKDGEISNLKNEIGNKNSEIGKLTKDLGDLEKVKAQLQSDLDTEKNHSAELSSKVDSLTATINAKDNEISQLQKQIEEIKKKLADKEAELARKISEYEDKLKKEAGDAVVKLQAKDSEIDKLKEQLAAKESELQQCKNEIANLKKEIQTEKQKNDDLMTALEAERSQSAGLSSQLDKVNQLLDEEKKRAADLAKELEDEKERGKKAASALESENAEKSKLLDELTKLKNELSKLKTDHADELSKLKDSHAQEIAALKEENSAELKKLNDEHANELTKIKTEHENALNELTEKYDNQINELKEKHSQEVNKLTEESKKLKEQMNEDIKKLKEKHAGEMKRIKDEHESEIKELNMQIEAEASMKSEALSVMGPGDLDILKKEHASELDKLKKDHANEVGKLKSEIKNLKAELEKLKSERDKLKEKLKKIEGQVGKDDEAKRLQDELNKLKQQHAAELNKLKTDLQGKDQSGELNKYKNELDRLKQQQEEETKNLRCALCCANFQINKMKEECDGRIKKVKEEYERIMKRMKEDCEDELKKLKETPTSIKKTCPCGAEIGVSAPPSPLTRVLPALPEPKPITLVSKQAKLDRLSKCTALIAEITKDSEGRDQFGLSMKTVVMSNVQPDTAAVSGDFERQLVSLEEERPINLSKSIENILAKALKSGLENLTFEELLDLHTRTTNAANIISDPMEPPSLTSISSGMDQPKVNLMRRIATLETDLAVKHKTAHDKIQILDRTLQVEKQRLSDMKNALILERKRNNDLVQRIGMQTRENANIEVERDLLKRQSSYHEDRLQKLIISVEQEKAERRKLEEELEKKKNTERSLKALLETEKERSKHLKNKANETIDLLRVRLERALESESQLKIHAQSCRTCRIPKLSQANMPELGNIRPIIPSMSGPSAEARRTSFSSPQDSGGCCKK